METKLLFYLKIIYFASYTSAQETDVSFDPTCVLRPMVGPCRAQIPMYYFDPLTRECPTFAWGGCQGNGNRFDSRDECLTTCIRTRKRQQRPRFCSLTFDYGWCFGSEHRYYYDFRWKVCKSTIWSGCGGNQNNFQSFEQCEQVCRFGLKPLISDDGRNRHKENRYLILNPNPLKYSLAALYSTTESTTTTTEPPSTIKKKMYFNRVSSEEENTTAGPASVGPNGAPPPPGPAETAPKPAEEAAPPADGAAPPADGAAPPADGAAQPDEKPEEKEAEKEAEEAPVN